MKLNKISILFFAVSAVIISSCKKEFLDRTPYDAVPFDNALESEADLDAAINGMYSTLRVPAFYGRCIPLMGDLLADNVYIFQVNSGRYIPFNTYAIFDDNGDVDGIWSVAYNAILQANQIIEADVPASDVVNEYRGEALAARALVYFELIRIFAAPYSTDNLNAPGVPLVLTYDPELKPARNTVGEIYDQIVADLNAAIGLMTIEKNSEYISSWVAKGILAKVYQYMGDWENAKATGEDLILNGGYSLIDSAGYIAYWEDPAPSEKSETLFELRLDATESNGYDALAAMYDDAIYGDAMCDTNFYNLYPDGDVRKLLMHTGTRGGQPVVWVNKYSNALNSSDYDDAKVLRLSEIYLLVAEAYHHTGDDATARSYLNTIAQLRNPSFAGYTSSGDDLVNDITNERRLELAFEGNRVFDLTRLGLDINRSTLFPDDAQFIPISDHRRIMPIPQYEINANSNMTQNPGY